VLAEEGMISPKDLDLIRYVDEPQDAWEHIRRFYQLKD
jgi:predicted Rossmann-fold nucleotide-binding protein